MKKSIIKKILEKLEMAPVNSNVDLARKIQGLTVHRAGIELSSGEPNKNYYNHIIGWGASEAKFLKKFSSQDIHSKIINVLNKNTPLLILSKNFKDFTKIFNITLSIANELKIPIIVTDDKLANITAVISAELIALNAKTILVHGSLVIINGVGVLIKGKSGIGKSEAVLELIEKGHTFVSDDTVELSKRGRNFMAQAAKLTRGLLEARGIGIINVPYIYGAKSIKYETILELVVELVPSDEINEVDRLGLDNLFYNVLGGKLPKIQIPAASGRSLASLIEAATNVFLAKKQGMDPLQDIAERRDK